MFQIRTIQRESKGRSDYTVVVPLRAKKIEPSFSPTIRIAEKPKAAARFHEEKSEKDFVKNSYGIFSRTFAVLLIGFFFLNPFLDVYADELPLAPVFPDVVTATSDEQQAITTEQTEQLNDGAIEQANIATTTTDIATSTPEVIAPVIDETIASSTLIVETETATTTEYQEPVSVSGTTTPPTDTVTSTPEAVATTSEEEQATTTADELQTGDEQAQDTSTETIAPPQTETVPPPPAETAVPQPPPVAPLPVPSPPAPIVNVIEKKYLFRENECTLLDDGAFYCLPPETANTANISNISLPRVFTENDAKSGSKEIFFEDTSGKTQITNNSTDDDAPAYDKNSNLIVWHSLINGRFQIMLYDRNASTTRPLTNTPYNNTDPKIRGKSVVWQGWANNNWEIFYLKDVTAEPLKIDQITTNEQPDMFPILSDNFITWQSFFGGSWRVFVYNMENGEISQISQPEAGRYENPRFALLFENRKENGEVETVGYDVVSGKEIPINAPHVPLPPPAPQGEEDKAVPVPTGQTGTGTTTPMKNPGGKDEEGHEA